MQYDLVIKRTLREAQGILWANLPPASNLPDPRAEKTAHSMTSRAPLGLCCEWPLMMSVKAAAAFERYLNKNVG